MLIEGLKRMKDKSNFRQITIDHSDYDFENDSFFFNHGGVQLESSIDLGNLIIDMGVDGSPIGFEILHASKMFNVPKSKIKNCLLYTSPSPRDGLLSRMPSSA